MEQVRVLGDHADHVVQRLQGDVAHVVAADPHRARSGSYSRATSAVMVVLPAPDGPTSAVSWPAGARKLTSCSTPAGRPAARAAQATDSSEASDTSAAVG